MSLYFLLFLLTGQVLKCGELCVCVCVYVLVVTLRTSYGMYRAIERTIYIYGIVLSTLYTILFYLQSYLDIISCISNQFRWRYA